MVIPVFNPAVDNLERTYLSSGVSAGVTALTVDNNNNFAANDRIMIGEIGREKTEIVTLSAVSGGNTLTVGATVFAHEANTPITRLRYDQVKYYRSTTGSSGTYSILTTVNMDVDNADLLTNYDDTVGLASYYYKISFYHSVSTLESSLSDPVGGSGYSRNTVGFLVDEILREVGDPNEEFTDRTEILGWFNEVNDDLLTRVKKPYSFLHTRAAYSTVAQDASGAGTYLAFPSDMWKFDRLDYNYVDSTTSPVTNLTYTVRVISAEEFRNKYTNTSYSASSTDNNDELREIALDTALDRIRLWPPSLTSRSNAIYVYYWKTFTQLDSTGDTFETPTPRIYKNFALSKFYLKKSASDQTITSLATSYRQDYEREIAKLKRADSKDGGSPRGFKFLPQDYKGNRGF